MRAHAYGRVAMGWPRRRADREDEKRSILGGLGSEATRRRPSTGLTKATPTHFRAAQEGSSSVLTADPAPVAEMDSDMPVPSTPHVWTAMLPRFHERVDDGSAVHGIDS
jgi:hypothetical protein